MSNDKLAIEQLKFKREDRAFYPLTTAEAVIFTSDNPDVMDDNQESIHGAIMELFKRLKELEVLYKPLNKWIEDFELNHEIAFNPRIVDNLVCESRIRSLSARQGVILKDLIDEKLGYEIVSQAVYDSIKPHEPNKIYFINEDMKIRRFYVGDYVFDTNPSDDPRLVLEYNNVTIPSSTTNITPIAIEQSNLLGIVVESPEGCSGSIVNGKLKITVPANLTVKDRTFEFTVIGKASSEEDDVTAKFTVLQLHEDNPSSELYIELNMTKKKVDASFGVANDIFITETNCATFAVDAPMGCSASCDGTEITYSWPMNTSQEKKVYEFIVYGYNVDDTAYTQTRFVVEQDRGGSEDIELIISPDNFTVTSAAGHIHEAMVRAFNGDAIEVTSWPEWIANVEYHEPSKMFNIEYMENTTNETRSGVINVVGIKAGKAPVVREIAVHQRGKGEGAYMDWNVDEYTASPSAIKLDDKIYMDESATNCVMFSIEVDNIDMFYNKSVSIRFDNNTERYYVAARLMTNTTGSSRECNLTITGETANHQSITKTIKVVQNG